MRPVDILEHLIWKLRGRHFIGKGRLLRLLSPGSGVRTVRIAPDVKIQLRLDDHLQRLMYMDILHHDWISALRATLEPGGTFLDVGANIGYFTLLAAGLVGSAGRVIAVEPIPRTFDLLRANIALNAFTQVQAERLALAAAPGVLKLHLPPTDAHQDYLVTKLAIPGWEAVEVPCATLDESFARWGISHVDLLKIDVEGAEPEVIAGGRSVLASGRVRAMVCEFSGAHLQRSGLTAQAVIADLERLGFHHARVDRRGRLVPHPMPMLHPDRDCNLVFVHRAGMAVDAR